MNTYAAYTFSIWVIYISVLHTDRSNYTIQLQLTM